MVGALILGVLGCIVVILSEGETSWWHVAIFAGCGLVLEWMYRWVVCEDCLEALADCFGLLADIVGFLGDGLVSGDVAGLNDDDGGESVGND